MLWWHWWCICTSFVAIKPAVIERFGTKPCWEKDCLAWLMLYQCIIVLSVTLLYFSGGPGVNASSWGRLNKNRWSLWLSKTERSVERASMYQLWTTYVILLLWYVHNGYERITASCERLTACLQSTRRVCMRALQSEGNILLIYRYFEIRVYFHPYYDMTLGFKPLGLVVALFWS